MTPGVEDRIGCVDPGAVPGPAPDLSSGTASQLELTRALGELLKKGIRPKRTIVICSWDGEEYGLTGSTEWGEEFKDELRKKGAITEEEFRAKKARLLARI